MRGDSVCECSTSDESFDDPEDLTPTNSLAALVAELDDEADDRDESAKSLPRLRRLFEFELLE